MELVPDEDLPDDSAVLAKAYNLIAPVVLEGLPARFDKVIVQQRHFL